MKINKPKLLLEIIIFIGLLIYVVITIVIPRYNEIFGSSDKFINTRKYKSLVEFKVGETNFGIILDKDYTVYHILYFDNTSICLYNQDLENNNLDSTSNQIIRKLIENNYLKVDTPILITTYEDEYSKKAITVFKKYLNKYKLKNKISYTKNDLITKAKSVSQDSITSDSYALVILDLYSKDMINNNETKVEDITEKQAKEYTNNVYKKIEIFMYDSNIKDLKDNNEELDITKIPGDESKIYFPTKNSYFYIKNSKVYAYIEINDLNNTYGYCYNGSIDDYQKGVCK